MNKKYLLVLGSLLVFGMAVFLWLFPYDASFPVLDPKGEIGAKELDLIIIASSLMLIVGIPVVIATFVFAWRYRAGNKKAKYDPDWDNSHLAEAIWWGFPCLIVLVLAIICWKSSHELDPYKPIVSDVKPLRIQVVALQWKWLFIYPEQQIATINYIQFPKDTPLNFEITADAPMNSFWIPQLGSQIYAMAGMRTRLHLIANEVGVYNGLNTQYNGDGFSDMHFEVHVVEPKALQKWFADVKKSSNALTDDAYHQLLQPSVADKPKVFSGVQSDLFNKVIMTYMMSVGPVHPRENTMKFQKD